MVFDADLMTQFYPYYSFYQTSLQSGENPLWNPYSSSGYPIFTGITNSLLSPVAYLTSLFLSAPANYHWTLFIYILLAIWCTDLFLRALGISFWGRMAGVLIYISSQLFLNLDVSTIAPIYLLPFLLFCIWQINAGGKKWLYILLGGAALGLAWLSSYPGFVIQILLVAGFFVLFLLWRNKKIDWGLIGSFALIFLLGALISIFYLYWGYVMSDLSERAGGFSYTQAARKAVSFFDLGRFWLPHFKLNYLAIGQATLYIGFLPLFFLISTFFYKKRDPVHYFFLAVYAVAFLIAVKYSPLFWLISKIPVLNLFRVPGRWMFVGSFGAAVVVAGVMHRFYLSQDKIGEKIYRWFKWLAGAAILSIVLIFLNLFFNYQNILETVMKNFSSKTLPVEYYTRLIETNLTDVKNVFDLTSSKVFWPVISIVLGMWLLYRYYQKNLSGRLFIALAGCLIILNFLTVLYPFHETFDAQLLKNKSPVIEFLQKHSGKFLSFYAYRPHFEYDVVPQAISIDDQVRSELLKLNSDLHLYFGLDGAGNSDSLINRRMSRLLAAVGEGDFPGGVNLADPKIKDDERVQLFKERKPLLDWLGIKYIISAYDLGRPFSKVFETKNPPPYDYPIMIFENQSSRPLAYFAKNVKIINEDEEVAFEKLFSAGKADFDLLECRSDCDALQNLSSNGKASVIARKNDFIQIKTSNAKSGLLVLLQNNLPGWKVFIDGDLAPIYYANSAFTGVAVPAGEHKIEFIYD